MTQTRLSPLMFLPGELGSDPITTLSPHPRHSLATDLTSLTDMRDNDILPTTYQLPATFPGQIQTKKLFFSSDGRILKERSLFRSF